LEVNGRLIRCGANTCASAIALTNAGAQALGLFWTYDELAVVAHGASGPVRGVYKKLDRVALGGHEVRGLNAIIVPEGLGISLLGQNFLSTIDPVRIEGDRMILGR
ncbi:MAG: retropepsin-like aspartic protease family protein, partial [Qipengyuania sp.]